MTPYLSLAPDVNGAQKLQANASAATTVTNYAQATITAVPRIQNPPDWFAPFQKDFVTAQTHAKNWLQNICPAVTTGVPKSIIEFNDTFQSKSGQILDALQTIENGGGLPTAQQRVAIGSLFANLTSAIESLEKSVTTLQTDIQNYSTDIKTDQNAFGNDLGTVSARFASGQDWIQQLTTAMGETFLDSNVLGPCISIVEINLDISLKIQGIGADPTIITLVFAKAILENQTNNAQASQQAVQAILDSWTTLKAKNEAVISDLNDAQDSDYTNILSQVDLTTAQTQWQQFADFAAGLIPTP